jgi:hypothetical protein
METQTKKLIRNQDLVARYQKTQRTLDRWKADGILPPPDVIIHDVPYWYPETIERNERERLSAKSPKAA